MRDEDDRSQWGQYLGIGLEIMMGVLLGLGVGWWLDSKFGWSPWGVLVGTMLGLASGMYLMIKQTLQIGGKK